MAVYLPVPILDELVRFVENDSTNENSVKAMTSGILNYYLPAANSYTVAPGQSRNNNSTEFVIDQTLAAAKRTSDPLSLEQLENTLQHANTELGRCWAIIIHGFTFKFYEYHLDLPEHTYLVPWGPPNQQEQNCFQAHHDSMAIDWMLRFMVQHDTLFVRTSSV
jgi:hypothetical protein